MKLFAMLSITSVLAICQAYGEVKLVHEYLLKPPRDRRALFAMALMPDQDVLSLVANDEGTWRLSRVRRWLDKQPLESSLMLPGLFQNGREGWSNWGTWSTRLLVTPDNKFAICIVSAYASTGRTREDLVNAVDLVQFRTSASSQISALAKVRGDYREYYLDRKGSLVVNASTFPRNGGDDTAGTSHNLAVFTLPALNIADQCEYSEWVRGGKVFRRENETTCAALLLNSGVGSLDDFSGMSLERVRAREAVETARPPNCAFLTYSSYLSRDGRFRWERCTEGHRGFWGNFVVTHPVENIFLVATGQKLGSITAPSDHPLQSSFATIEDRDFLLVMEGGTRLGVYEIIR
jgi:hypothetical protein